MSCLTRQQILGVDDLPRTLISVPEWGGHVYIRTLTAGERDRLEAKIHAGSDKINMAGVRAMLAAIAIVDESGKQLFQDKDIGDLNKKSGAAMTRVFEAIQDMNFMNASDVEELAKNSGAAHTSSSSTVSPKPLAKGSRKSKDGRRGR